MTATSGRRDSYSLYLGAHEGASACARLTLARCLKDWCLFDALYDDAALVAVELVNNAARLGRPFRMRCTRLPAAVLIEVVDTDPRPPVMGDPYDLESESGRGLILVDALAEDWGHTYDNPCRPREKTVWARVGKSPSGEQLLVGSQT